MGGAWYAWRRRSGGDGGRAGGTEVQLSSQDHRYKEVPVVDEPRPPPASAADWAAAEEEEDGWGEAAPPPPRRAAQRNGSRGGDAPPGRSSWDEEW